MHAESTDYFKGALYTMNEYKEICRRCRDQDEDECRVLPNWYFIGIYVHNRSGLSRSCVRDVPVKHAETADSCEKLRGEISRVEPIMPLPQIGLRERQGPRLLGRMVALWMIGEDWDQVNMLQCSAHHRALAYRLSSVLRCHWVTV